MRVATFGESPVDEAFALALTRCVVGATVEPARPRFVHAGGWTGVLRTVDAAVKAAYHQQQADAFVALIDTDDTPFDERVRQLRERVARAVDALPRVVGRRPPLTAVGAAVPALEAWLVAGRRHEVREDQWTDGLTNGDLPFDRVQLKRRVFGSRHRPLHDRIDIVRAEAERLCPQLDRLADRFPLGFAPLLADLRSWRHRGGAAP